ncbi:MAG: tRNA preQ1(34) S-adenosylmethionine ribosyltransferase-isomerase QueA [Myxococcota bacterium]|nr:tRNA preQ1(34) S-adenosylmethionine ribosyltransferase-isomerase QueA [Myxococcota bacterium]
MNVSDYDFELPESLIAQYPVSQRDHSRLMVLRRSDRSIEHRSFRELPELLRANDLLVTNNTKVLKARLRAYKPTGGKVEILLISPQAHARQWRVMATNSRTLKPGMELKFDSESKARVVSNEGQGFCILEFDNPVEQLAAEQGTIPLPPYMGRKTEEIDEERYQTVYASEEHQRSVAAPTAGLHFTPELFAELRDKGVQHQSITLDVGPGTFMPVRGEDIKSHQMHLEAFEVTTTVAESIKEAQRVIAVGTTVVRTLESLEQLQATSGATQLFIYPGFTFKYVDGLLTNFHLPKSTLLMLVSAFADREFILQAYAEAVSREYRFFSYGDAMLIL